MVAASVLWGIDKVRGLRKRRDDLLCVIAALQYVCAELGSTAAPLEEIFASVPGCRLFEEISTALSAGNCENIRQLWHDCVYAKAGLSLSEEQSAELDRIGAVLGRFPATEQLPVIERCVERLELHAREAGVKAEKGTKLYLGMAISAGSMAAVVLL